MIIPVQDAELAMAEQGAHISRPGPRIVCQFSCGAASAVATKLILAQHPDAEIVNAFIQEEDEDNRRFLADCGAWFGKQVTVLRDEKYNASTHQVWRKRRYIKGPNGAPCSKSLKRDILNAWSLPGDVIVLGYTAEEQDRYDAWIDANNRPCLVPLIERGLTKADCLAIVHRAGIVLPKMYLLGYLNANCKGCPKGGAGYWNKIRVDFPDVYEEVALIQDMLGPGSWFLRDRRTGERVSLRNLDPTHGTHADLDFSCSFFCEMTSRDLIAGHGKTTESEIREGDRAQH